MSNLPQTFTRGKNNICIPYGMNSEDYKVSINIIKEKGIKTLSDTNLINFFEQCLLNLNNSYNKNMELYGESEKYYEVSKSEIIFRFNNQRFLS